MKDYFALGNGTLNWYWWKLIEQFKPLWCRWFEGEKKQPISYEIWSKQNCEHSCKRLKCALGADIFAYLSGKMCNKLKSSVCSSCCTMCSGCIYRNCIICVARPRYRIFPIKDEWIYAISISIQSHCHAWWDIPIWVKKKKFQASSVCMWHNC